MLSALAHNRRVAKKPLDALIADVCTFLGDGDSVSAARTRSLGLCASSAASAPRATQPLPLQQLEILASATRTHPFWALIAIPNHPLNCIATDGITANYGLPLQGPPQHCSGAFRRDSCALMGVKQFLFRGSCLPHIKILKGAAMFSYFLFFLRWRSHLSSKHIARCLDHEQKIS